MNKDFNLRKINIDVISIKRNNPDFPISLSLLTLTANKGIKVTKK